MRKMLLWLLALLLVINGLVMLGWPEWWYHAVPTVPHTGPFNPHFVRDIGCAYLVCGGALVWLGLNPIRGWAAALTGVDFLSAHAFVHLWDALPVGPACASRQRSCRRLHRVGADAVADLTAQITHSVLKGENYADAISTPPHCGLRA